MQDMLREIFERIEKLEMLNKPEKQKTENLNFSEALELVKKGEVISRKGWKDSNIRFYLISVLDPREN
jgi:hypothetical protein